MNTLEQQLKSKLFEERVRRAQSRTMIGLWINRRSMAKTTKRFEQSQKQLCKHIDVVSSSLRNIDLLQAMQQAVNVVQLWRLEDEAIARGLLHIGELRSL